MFFPIRCSPRHFSFLCVSRFLRSNYAKNTSVIGFHVWNFLVFIGKVADMKNRIFSFIAAFSAKKTAG